MPYRDHDAIIRRLRELAEQTDRLRVTADELLRSFQRGLDTADAAPPAAGGRPRRTAPRRPGVKRPRRART